MIDWRGAGAVWAGMATALAAGALLARLIDPSRIDWQFVTAWTQPWRWWTAGLVHLSERHLWANLGGCMVIGAFGWAANCSRRDVAAWAAAWPLTHVLLVLRPDLLRYGGLSGVLHAGVAVAAFSLVSRGQGSQCRIGALVLAGLLVKLTLEQPWADAVQAWAGWDIGIAPLAHVTGALAGLTCATVAWVTGRARRAATMRP